MSQQVPRSIEQDLFKFLCEQDPQGTEEQILTAWISQAPEIPTPDCFPVCLQMIRNMRKSKVDKAILKKYGPLFY